jgi:hypothetical protein
MPGEVDRRCARTASRGGGRRGVVSYKPPSEHQRVEPQGQRAACAFTVTTDAVACRYATATGCAARRTSIYDVLGGRSTGRCVTHQRQTAGKRASTRATYMIDGRRYYAFTKSDNCETDWAAQRVGDGNADCFAARSWRTIAAQRRNLAGARCAVVSVLPGTRPTGFRQRVLILICRVLAAYPARWAA